MLFRSDLLNDSALIYKSEIDLAGLYSYSGKFRESEQILKRIQAQDLPEKLLLDYYDVCLRFYSHYASSSKTGGKYRELLLQYRDSLMSCLDPESIRYGMNKSYELIEQGDIDAAEQFSFKLLEKAEPDSPDYAIITHYLAIIYRYKKNPELEKTYYTLSAITDIQNAIKENASCQELALISYNNGDLAKAFQYTQSAIEDAVFSGVQFRTTEMSEFYSIINVAYQKQKAKMNSILKIFLILISVLTIFLVLLVVYIYKQMKKLAVVKEELSESNSKLLELNTELHDKNELLLISNDMKEQYIAQFFNVCSTYIDKMEDYRKSLQKLGINRQFEELIKRLKSTTDMETELEELYKHFDSIFLNLYPTFVTDFNALLAEDEQIVLKSDDLLNKELRIYALLRLGITDSVKIARFLRCSMSTIYNYRTKMRNKCASNRGEFEEKVMKIGTINKNQA